MMNNLNDRIDLYIKGMLSGQELDDFNELIKSDSLLADDIKLQQEIRKAVIENEAFELREKLNIIHRKHKTKQKRQNDTPIFKIFWYRAAAGFIILTVISFVLYFYLKPNLNEKLFSENYKTYDLNSTVRSSNTNIDSFHSALEKYSSGDYSNAWKIINEITKTETNNMTAFFVRGISAIETDNYNDAIYSFRTILKNNKSLYVEQAEWYIALCFIKQNDIGKAKSQLIKIVNSSSFYKTNAEKILNEIN